MQVARNNFSMMTTTWLVVAALSAIGIAPAVASAQAVGTEPPAFTLNDLDGKPHRLADYRGKVVLLDFWATWCGPCKAVMEQHLKGMHAQYHDKGFVIIGIGMAGRDTPQQQKAFCDQMGYKWIKLFDAERTVATAYGVRGIPHLVLIGRDGRVVATGHGNIIPQVRDYLTQHCREVEPARPLTAAEITHKLASEKMAVNFNETSVSDALEMLAHRLGAPIEMTEGAQVMAADGETTMQLADVTLKAALQMICDMHGLKFDVRDGKIIVDGSPTAVAPQNPPAREFSAEEFAVFKQMMAGALGERHRAARESTVHKAIEQMNARDKERVLRMIDGAMGNPSFAAHRELLRELRSLVTN